MSMFKHSQVSKEDDSFMCHIRRLFTLYYFRLKSPEIFTGFETDGFGHTIGIHSGDIFGCFIPLHGLMLSVS